MIAAFVAFVSGIVILRELKGEKELEGGQTIWTDMVKFKVVASLFLNSYVVHPLVVMIVGE